RDFDGKTLADFQNPQQEPGMEKRLLLVFALTFLIILISQPLLKKYGPKTPETPPPAQTQPVSPAQQAAITAPAPVIPIKGATQATAEAEVVVENDLYKIRFSNRGAQVKSWVLKKFKDDKGQPLELVNATAAAKYGYPLSLWAYDETLRNKLNSVLYVRTPDEADALSAPADISFEYSDGDIAVRKKFSFDHSYLLSVETSVVQKESSVSAFPTWPAAFGDESNPASYAAARVEYQNGGDVERTALKKVIGGNTIRGPFQWAGVSDQYFAAVFLPEDPAGAAMVTLHGALDNPQDAKHPLEVLGAAVGQLGGTTMERMYVGPKALDVLESVPVAGLPTGTEPDLRKLVDFGWLGLIARPLFLWLKWTYNHIVPNWGWAIVIQTLIINLALLPLRISQMKSMLKMQRVAPQIKSIQEKYKKYGMRDPRKQAMNEEIAAIYKTEGVNPAGGCLPLIIQMPFLFAYYRMLGVALDLRLAHWAWVPDLSSPDPRHILPIAVIISMLFMQRMTPQAGMDPQQQKMMNLFMPVMLGFISWNLAAGLCLYWSVGNLIGIVQQLVMNRTPLGREMREMMEKRARKKDK
ncbi:MAG TPA: membrane protein insertase YidC, partial [Terriglobales bacterium]|nr:membrane protein insertase YidC [Terriglobales bacterium]